MTRKLIKNYSKHGSFLTLILLNIVIMTQQSPFWYEILGYERRLSIGLINNSEVLEYWNFNILRKLLNEYENSFFPSEGSK